jgi:hypothetical protein
MHQVLTDKDESEAENNRAYNAKVEWAVLQVIWCLVNVEDQVEHEKVIERQHPLQDVTTHPHVAITRTLPPTDPTEETNSCKHPKESVEQCAGNCQCFRISMENDIVENYEDKKTPRRRSPKPANPQREKAYSGCPWRKPSQL